MIKCKIFILIIPEARLLSIKPLFFSMLIAKAVNRNVKYNSNLKTLLYYILVVYLSINIKNVNSYYNNILALGHL